METDDARILIDYLNETLAKPINEREGCERVKFITGIQYRHLLVIKGGNKHIVCAPPHDHPNEAWRDLLVKPDTSHSTLHTPHSTLLTPQQTADLLNEMILKSQELLAAHPFNLWNAKSAASARQTASGLGAEAIVPRWRRSCSSILR